MKKYIKAEKEIDLKLPSLDRAIKECQAQDLMFSDFHYRVIDDGVPGSFLVILADWNEEVNSYDFYQSNRVDRCFKKFEAAVQSDTGDADFYFEPATIVEFSGRAWMS